MSIEAKYAAAMDEVDAARMEDRMHPHYRPGELILAQSVTLVECQLPNSPNFRTERYSLVMSPDTKLAHTAARRHAGEPLTDPEYSIPEHEALIAQLRDIDPVLIEPRPLDSYFDELWQDPRPTIRSWRPKK